MLRVLYDEISENETKDDIALYNLKQSDINFNKETFICSSLGWIKNDSNRTFQDLETYLRNNDFNTHLLAKPHKYTEDIELENPNSNETLSYECVFCCKPEQYCLEDLYKIHSSYDENFNNLKYSGTLKVKNEEKVDEVEDSSDGTLISKLSNNEIKLNFVRLSPKDSISQMSDDIRNSTGKAPRTEIIGKYNDKQPIITFLLEDGKLASHIGWTIEDVDGELKYTLVDLNTYYSNEKV